MSTSSRPASPTNADFSTQAYWDARYASEGADAEFDWFKSWDEIKGCLGRYLGPPGVGGEGEEGKVKGEGKGPRVLMLGCGNSTLSADMYADGYTDIVNIDYSPILISQMSSRHPQMAWHVLDVRDLPSHAQELGGQGSFDVVVDKGTIDALMAEKGSVWDPSEEVRENVRREVDGALRMLKPSGTFWYMTWQQPHFRSPYLKREGWKLEVETFDSSGGGFPYYIYTLRRDH